MVTDTAALLVCFRQMPLDKFVFDCAKAFQVNYDYLKVNILSSSSIFRYILTDHHHHHHHHSKYSFRRVLTSMQQSISHTYK